MGCVSIILISRYNVLRLPLLLCKFAFLSCIEAHHSNKSRFADLCKLNKFFCGRSEKKMSVYVEYHFTQECYSPGMGTDFEKKTATCVVTRWISLHPHHTEAKIACNHLLIDMWPFKVMHWLPKKIRKIPIPVLSIINSPALNPETKDCSKTV